MTNKELDATLRTMVQQFGYAQVARSLREVKRSQTVQRSTASHPATRRSGAVSGPKKKRSPRTALGYVTRMKLPDGQGGSLVEAAARFDDKTFLPSIGDVRNFCAIHLLDEPRASRASAIPGLFRFIAAMDPNERQALLDSGRFSGPAELGPIADAIRDAGRERRRARLSGDTRTTLQRENASPPVTATFVPASSE